MNARLIRYAAWSIAVALCLLGRVDGAKALTCNATISDVNFGNIDVLPATAIDITATMNISCSAITLAGVRVCPYLGDGSGGRDGTGRYMQGPSATLTYQLYSDNAYSVIWGNPSTGFGSAPTVTFTGNALGTGTGSTSLTIYGRILSGQSPVAAGTYVSNFTVADVDINYDVNLFGLNPCNGVQVLTQHVRPTFKVQAIVENNCNLTTNNINFGNHGVLTSAVTADALLRLKCTPSAAYAVALNNGLNGSSPTTCKMKNGSNTITYGLYKDGGFASPWGNGAGETVSGTGNGANQDYTVHGRVPAQTTPPAGTYNDTIVVTVTY